MVSVGTAAEMDFVMASVTNLASMSTSIFLGMSRICVRIGSRWAFKVVLYSFQFDLPQLGLVLVGI